MLTFAKPHRAEINRLQAIHAITQHISSLASDVVAHGAVDPLGPFENDFTRLIEDFRSEYDEYDLDEVVVGAIAQVVSKRLRVKSTLFGQRLPLQRQLAPLFREFEPLAQSDTLLNTLQKWKRAYRYSETDRTQLSAVEVYGATQPPSGNGNQTGYVPTSSTFGFH